MGRPRLWPHQSSPRSLKVRLTVAFFTVALFALVLLSVLSLLFIRSDLNKASQRQATTVERALGSAVTASYERAHGWSRQDLAPVLALASDLKVQITVIDLAGKTVTVNGFQNGSSLSDRLVVPVVVNGSKVGALVLVVEPNGLLASALRLEGSIALAVAGSGVIAILVAIAASIIVSRRIATPLVALTKAARLLTLGNWSTRVGPHSGPREIHELAETFDSMAATLEREDEIRRALTSEVAHELRTPLAVLQATSEALVDGVLPPTRATFLSINDEALRLSRMIEDLEALASAQAARLHLATQPVELDSLAGDVAAALHRAFERARIGLELRLAPAVVFGDETRLRQIVANLLTNAVKFTPPGGHVILEVLSNKTGSAILSVQDSGVGISKEEIPRLFDRFWRSPSACKVSGSGIGLTVVAELVEAHHGTVRVESELGKGSHFLVSLPLGPSQAGVPASSSSVRNADGGRMRPRVG